MTFLRFTFEVSTDFYLLYKYLSSQTVLLLYYVIYQVVGLLLYLLMPAMFQNIMLSSYILANNV